MLSARPSSRQLRRLAAAALVSMMAVPGMASASTTITRSGDVVTITGDDAPSRLVTSEYFTRAQLQDDLGGAVVAGAGCAQLSASSVDCGDFGPAARVVANLGGGDDFYKWATIDPSQEIDGGSGNDTIEAGAGKDTVRGGPGNDDLNGGRGDDTLDGGDGDDTVDGWDGSDTVTGGAGRDKLLGDGGTIYAGGADTLLARDGEADTLDCGGGADSAVVDGADVVSACAQVDRPAAAGGGAAPVAAPAPGAGGLSVGGSVAAVPKLGKVLAGSGVGIRLTPTTACVARVALAVTAKEARRLKIGRKALTLGTSRATTLQAGRSTTVSVTLTRAYRRKLRAATSIKGNLVVACADAAGGTFSGAVAVRLRR